MSFTAFGICVHVQESPKNGQLWLRLGSVLGTYRLVLLGRTSWPSLSPLPFILSSRWIAECFVSDRTRKRAGWERHKWMVHKSPLRFWLWACSALMVPGTGDVF